MGERCNRCYQIIKKGRHIKRRVINRYKVDGNTVYLTIILTNKKKYEAIFDKKYLLMLQKYSWRINANGYAITSKKSNNIAMQSLIINCPKGKVIDHINHNKLDNRDCNLRICTIQQNDMNKSIQSNNTVGFRGITFDKKRHAYRVNIKLNRKVIYIGQNTDLQKAIQLRIEAENKYFGEYGYENSMNIMNT